MYAEMILDDGRVVATEDEQFMIGSEVFVVNDDGEASPLAAGSYTMEDGAKLTIDDNGKILDMGEEKEAEQKAEQGEGARGDEREPRRRGQEARALPPARAPAWASAWATCRRVRPSGCASRPRPRAAASRCRHAASRRGRGSSSPPPRGSPCASSR